MVQSPSRRDLRASAGATFANRSAERRGRCWRGGRAGEPRIHRLRLVARADSGDAVADRAWAAARGARELGERLTLRFPLDAAVAFYAFSGNPLPLPAGGEPWDQVRAFSIGAQARYRLDEHWSLLVAANVA